MSSRPSSIYRAPPTQSRRSLVPSSQSHYLPGDNFPFLECREISAALGQCEFTANEELVTRPNSQYMQLILEEVLEAYMGVHSEIIERMIFEKPKADTSASAIRGNNGNGNSNGGDLSNTAVETDDDTSASLFIITLYRIAFQFLAGIGIKDFTLSDILKPDPYRARRIFSAIINYSKFREQQSSEYEHLEKECTPHVDEMKEVLSENDQLTNKINQFKRKLEQDTSSSAPSSKRASLRQITTYNNKLALELKKLKKTQEALNNEITKYKHEKLRLTERIDDNDYLIGEAGRELESLKSYLQTDVGITKTIISDLKRDLSTLKDTISKLSHQNENLTITIESFITVENNLKPIFKQLDDIMKDSTREEASFNKLTQLEDFKGSLLMETTELKNEIDLIEKKLSNQRSLIERLQSQNESKMEQDEMKVEELKAELSDLNRERDEVQNAISIRNAKIDEYKTKIRLTQRELEEDEKEVELSLSKLNNHVKFYLSEMTKKLTREESG